MSWNDERVDALKKLWADGLSASQIANRLGGVTRNAVIAKVHRLGLSGRATTSRGKSHRPKARAKRVKPATRQKPGFLFGKGRVGRVEPYKPAQEAPAPTGQRKRLVDLDVDDCRWPIGEPEAPDFHFCGAVKISGLPYCEVHARRAFQPAAVRRGVASESERALIQVSSKESVPQAA